MNELYVQGEPVSSKMLNLAPNLKVTQHLERGFQISYEVVPTQEKSDVAKVLAVVSELAEYNPPFIDVTSRAARVIEKHMRLQKEKFLYTAETCDGIQALGIDSVPHVCIDGFTIAETDEYLRKLHDKGHKNILAIKGDPIGYVKDYQDEPTHTYAIDLVRHARGINDFCIGVAGYPQKHYQSPSLDEDILRLKEKVDAGADYIATQMVPDAATYFSFVEKCREAGIEQPIIPGIKIITTVGQLIGLPKHIKGVTIAQELEDAIRAAPEKVKQIGAEWAAREIEKFETGGAPVGHIYVMRSAKPVHRVMELLHGHK
jgi:methylenetetrahydrofolate reductase (NADPH)